jgi:putative oxidoreductase
LGVPIPGLMAWVVTLVEIVGGALLILGLGTRIWGLLLAVEMAFTLTMVKAGVGLIAPQGEGAGAELDLLLMAGGLALALMGPGALALDRLVGLEPAAA